GRAPPSEDTGRRFAASWRALQQQIASAKPADVDRLTTPFVEETRAKVPAADLDALVFAQALADARLDPGTLRLCDRLLHPTPTTLPRTPEALRLRQLADLAMRVEVQAWPRDAVEALLRCTDNGEKALQQRPYLPGYTELLAEPAMARHAGEVRLWTRGYSSSDEAKERLSAASAQFERLVPLNEKWRQCEKALDETLAELPWFADALESVTELRA